MKPARCACCSRNPLRVHHALVDAGLRNATFATLQEVDDPIWAWKSPGVWKFGILLPSIRLRLLAIGGANFLVLAFADRFGGGGGGGSATVAGV